MAKRLKVLIINISSGDLRERVGAVRKDAEDQVWKLYVYRDNVVPLPLPNFKYIHGHAEVKGVGPFKSPKEYVVLGTKDDTNYFYMQAEDSKAKVIPEDYRKWHLLALRRIVEKFQSVPNWQKLLMFGGPILIGVLTFAGFLLFLQQGIPRMESMVQIAADACRCACEFVVNDTSYI